ncbi:MAG TPA: hypothetical protein PKE63_01700, partial [Lacibacter sp.]|nr:hypothetical protein [Lacibacter sp.]
YGYGVALGLVFFVHKGGSPDDGGSGRIFQNPPDGFTMAEGFVFFRVKYLCNVFVQRTYPIGVMLVYGKRQE